MVPFMFFKWHTFLTGKQGSVEDLLIPRSHIQDENELEKGQYGCFLERGVGHELRQLVAIDGTPTDIAGKNKRKKKATKEDEISGKKGQTRSKDDEDFLIK